MAKKKKEEKQLNYNEEIRRLKSEGPGQLYWLWGPEDYLRERYLQTLKELCVPQGEDSFSYKRLNGPELDLQELSSAIDAIPFLSERSFVELRGVDLNRFQEGDTLQKLLEDIPDYCTVVFVQSAAFEPDGRLKLIRFLKDKAIELKFTEQTQDALVKWIAKRFSAYGKRVELEAAQHLIFVSGDLMNRLIPEIEKVAAYAKGEVVTVADVDAVAHHLPEAIVFEMTDHLAKREYNAAMRVLEELLSDKNNEPIAMLAVIGGQMRRLYAARLAAEKNLGASYVMDVCKLRFDSIASRLIASSRSFSLPQLKRAVELCAETDYQMKSSSSDDLELLKELVLRIAAGETHA